MSNKTVTPYKNRLSKKEQVAGMFNHIAYRYDFLNHFLSMGIDRLWRKKVINHIRQQQPLQMLDVATGTGDLAIAAARRIRGLHIEAVDIAAVMLEKAQQKVEKLNCADRLHFKLADAENFSYDDNRFDVVTTAFGVRNFEDLSKGLSEMYRVMKNDGELVILEFATPRKGLFAAIFKLYFSLFVPWIGRFFSGNYRAYSYLQESVHAFPEKDEFVAILEKAGFRKCYYRTMTFGVACMYFGKK